MKAIEQYFHVVLFIMLYNVALTFKSVYETLVCDHSNFEFLEVSCSKTTAQYSHLNLFSMRCSI